MIASVGENKVGRCRDFASIGLFVELESDKTRELMDQREKRRESMDRVANGVDMLWSVSDKTEMNMCMQSGQAWQESSWLCVRLLCRLSGGDRLILMGGEGWDRSKSGAGDAREGRNDEEVQQLLKVTIVEREVVDCWSAKAWQGCIGGGGGGGDGVEGVGDAGEEQAKDLDLLCLSILYVSNMTLEVLEGVVIEDGSRETKEGPVCQQECMQRPR